MISDLGQSISGALRKLVSGSGASDEAVAAAVKEISTSLLASNVSPRVVKGLRARISERLRPESVPPAANKAKLVQSVVFEELCRILDPGVQAHAPSKDSTSVVVFVGLQGSGKTTSCCKYAFYHKRRGFRVGLVCADTFRAGAFDQLRQNALKTKVPFFGSHDEADPVKVAREGVAKFRSEKFNLIVVDTSGRHTQESELFTEMEEIVAAVAPDSIVFVVDAGIGQAAEMHARAFKDRVGVGSVIVTKVDGAARAGGALSSVAATGSPISFVGTGEGMHDLEIFDAKGFVGKMLGMGDVTGLLDKLQGLGINEEEMLEKMKKGRFTLGDFYDQYQQILQLGPISKLLGMIPGFGSMPIPDERKFKRMTYMFDSMTTGELATSGECFRREPGRVNRVAAGSGVQPAEVMELIYSYGKVAEIMKKLGGSADLQALMGADPSEMGPAERAKMRSKMKSVLPGDLFSKMSEIMKQ